MERLVSHISDTARWVATYRALETERADALFRDPFAARLAGERGRQIAAGLPGAMRRNSWPLVMRTKTIDDLVLGAVAEGSDRVINLAAGLDTRPYRLDLPSSLVWIEADLPGILDEKERALRGEAARCVLQRERVDLADAEARRRFLDRAVDGARRAVVVTEGLLIYLTETMARELAEDLGSRASIASWIVDLVSPPVLQMIRKNLGQRFSDDAEMRFAPPNGVGFFRPYGWRAHTVLTLLREAARAKRLPLLLQPFARFPDPDPQRVARRAWSAVVRFDHVTASQ